MAKEPKYETLQWERDLEAEGMDPDEVGYRRFRQEMLLSRAAQLQNAAENLATALSIGLEGGTAEQCKDAMRELREKHPDEGLLTAIQEFREEVTHSARFLAGYGFDRLEMDAVA